MKLDKYIITLAVCSVLALLLRIFLTPFGTFGVDVATFQNWSEVLIRYPFDRFYEISRSDYLPGYNYFLWFLGKILYWLANRSILIDPKLLFKLPAIVADLGNALLIYLLAKRFTTNKKAFIAACLFLFNPSILINSTFWGQMDSVITFLLLSSLYSLTFGQYFISAFILGFCQSIKPVSLIALPFFLLFLRYKSKSGVKILLYISVFAISTLISFYPFNNQNDFMKFFLDINSMVSDRWPYATINAFNFWVINSISEHGNLQRISDQSKFLFFPLQYWGYLIFLSIYLYIFLVIQKSIKLKRNLILLVIIGLSMSYLAMFTFFTRMHERHIFYALPFISMLLPLVSLKGKLLFGSIFLTSTFNVFFSMRLVSSSPIILQSWQLFLLFLPNILTIIYLGLTIRKAKAPLDK